MSRDLLSEVAHVSKEMDDLQGLTRPLLELIQRVTGLESTYLTRIDWGDDVQEILYSRNTGTMEIPEGLRIPWQDTVCRRALESGLANTCEVPDVFGDSQAAKDLGIQTYVSVPVRTKDEDIFGTLCAAGSERVPVDTKAMEVLGLFARLIADQVERERAAAEATTRAERAEERLRSRARFLAEASHMLKTPLTVIKGWASMLARGRGEVDLEEHREGLKLIESRADELARQIDDLLDEARTEVLVSELELKAVELGPLLQGAAAAFGARPSHPIEVSVTGAPVALADERALDQVLGHLIENAIKYSPEGGPIELRASEQHDAATIEIEDRGVGLPEGVDPFEPFQRGLQEQTRGVGLGLHIVRNFVVAMQGGVSARRNPDRGSTFVVKLRRA